MAAPPRGGLSARTVVLGAYSVAHRVAVAAPPRVLLAALYVLFGVLWLANTRTIAKAVERCFGVCGFLVDDMECRISFQVPVGMALFSPIMLWDLWSKKPEAFKAGVEAPYDALPPDWPALEPGALALLLARRATRAISIP